MLRIVFKIKEEKECFDEDFLVREKVLSKEYGLVKKLFFSLDNPQLTALNCRAQASDMTFQPMAFSSYYYMDCSSGTDPDVAIQALRESPYIDWAYQDSSIVIAPHHHSPKKPLACYQGYLYDAPKGIGVSYAWRRKGGRGDAGVKFVDVEQGWLFEHESLDLHKIPNTGINHGAYSDHGAAVMGIILMKDRGSGGIGITPLVKGSVMSIFRPGGMYNTPDAILSALAFLEAGDILLLETQILDPESGSQLWPVEIREANFDVIRLATALGITVIEPCGNGNIHSSSGNNLDEYRNHQGQRILDRNDNSFKDSGAIMVAAATSNVPHQRMQFSNYGNRIDCYSWGEDIVTAGLHPYSSGIAINTYTHRFGGSSGAAAIVAGVAISLQSMFEANHQCRLKPQLMRQIMGGPSNGTVSAGGTEADGIGIMPDLKKITMNYIDNFDHRMDGIIQAKGVNIEIPSIQVQAV